MVGSAFLAHPVAEICISKSGRDWLLVLYRICEMPG